MPNPSERGCQLKDTAMSCQTEQPTDECPQTEWSFPSHAEGIHRWMDSVRVRTHWAFEGSFSRPRVRKTNFTGKDSIARDDTDKMDIVDV